MKVYQLLLPGLFLSIAVSPAHATGSLADLGKTIEQSLYSGNTQALLNTRQSLQQASVAADAGKYQYYYLGYTDYALASLYADNDNGKATEYVDEAEDALSHALKLDADLAEAEALLGSSYGLEIGLHPWHGMWLDPKSGKHLAHAMQLAPDNPRVQLLQGIADYQTPKQYGGDRDRAMQEYQHALELFDAYKLADGTAPDWGRAMTHAWLGQAELKKGDIARARTELQAALALAPDYRFVQAKLAALPTDATAAPAAGTAPTKPPAGDTLAP